MNTDTPIDTNPSPKQPTQRLKIKDVQVAATVFTVETLITDKCPKIVFIGRSNVGKSSLLNKLVQRKNLARTSSKPGKTVSINYFQVNQSFYFVDLPGYGYAKISKTEAQRIRTLMTAFFERTENIKLIVLLIDSRRGFLPPDIEILAEILNKGFRVLTVLTKSDKLRTSELFNQKQNLQNRFGLKTTTFSIKSEENRDEMLNFINKSIME